jgi:nucleoside-diphosphate-sugar epimerase
MTPAAVFIVGCAYVGLRLLPHVRLPITVLSHSPARVPELERLGADVIIGDLDGDLPQLPVAQNLIYYFAPPPRSNDIDPRLANFLSALHGKPTKIVLISTTGIYGDCQGAWITENHPPAPQVARARRRLDAENSLRQWGTINDVPYTIVRVPGIYGSGRLPLARLHNQTPVLAEADSPYSNRIHVDDLVRVCLAAGETDQSDIFHVSDGTPTTMTDYFLRVAAALDLPPPPIITRAQAEHSLSREMLEYLAESKRLDITKMRCVLGVDPRYPDLASGLAQAVAEMRNTAED